MFLKKSKYRNALLITTGMLAGILLVYVAYTLLYGSKDQANDSSANSETGSATEIKMVTVPFMAEFALQNVANYEDIGRCGQLPWMRFIFEGSDSAPILGTFTVHMDFCVQTGAGIYSDMVDSYFAAEGDSLFIRTWGQIRPSDENDPPYYTGKWNDPFEFTGGTGRFEGASGGGMTQCYNSGEDFLSHQTWEGTLTMKAD